MTKPPARSPFGHSTTSSGFASPAILPPCESPAPVRILVAARSGRRGRRLVGIAGVGGVVNVDQHHDDDHAENRRGHDQHQRQLRFGSRRGRSLGIAGRGTRKIERVGLPMGLLRAAGGHGGRRGQARGLRGHSLGRKLLPQDFVVFGLAIGPQQAEFRRGRFIQQLLRQAGVLPRLKRAQMDHPLIGGRFDHVGVGLEQANPQQPIVVRRLLVRLGECLAIYDKDRTITTSRAPISTACALNCNFNCIMGRWGATRKPE